MKYDLFRLFNKMYNYVVPYVQFLIAARKIGTYFNLIFLLVFSTF